MEYVNAKIEKRVLDDVRSKVVGGGVGVWVRDQEISGFEAYVGKKRTTFYFRYRRKHDGARMTEKLGELGAVTVAEARRRATSARDLLSDGAAISERDRAAKDDSRYRVDVLLERFIFEHYEGKGDPAEACDSPKNQRRGVELHIKPIWTGLDIRRLCVSDYWRVIRPILDRGEKSLAISTHTRARQFTRWCVGEGLIADDPFKNLREKPCQENERQVALWDKHLSFFWRNVDVVGYPSAPWLKCCLYTMTRREEAAKMRWVDLRLEGDDPAWLIPATITKSKRPLHIPLAPQAVRLLSSLPRHGEWVFTTTGTKPISGYSYFKGLVNAAFAERWDEKAHGPFVDWDIHDLRRTARSLIERDIRPNGTVISDKVMARLMNHATPKLSKIYNINWSNPWEYWPERREVLHLWADRIEGIVATYREP